MCNRISLWNLELGISIFLINNNKVLGIETSFDKKDDKEQPLQSNHAEAYAIMNETSKKIQDVYFKLILGSFNVLKMGIYIFKCFSYFIWNNNSFN